MAQSSISNADADRIRGVLDDLFPTGKLSRVLLITPPDATADIFKWDMARLKRYANYPAYGLGLLAEHLRHIGVEPMLLNLNHRLLEASFEIDAADSFDFDAIWKTAVDDAVKQFKPDLVGVTCMFTMTHTSLSEVCAYVGSLGLPLAIGGVHVSNDVENVLNDIPAAHFAFLRESEIALKQFVRVANGEEEPGALGQIIVNHPDGRIRCLEDRRPTAEELDVIPSYDLMQISDLSRYGFVGNYHGFKPAGTRFATVQSNRGCRAQCTFCSVRNFNGPTVRQRSVESVLDELQLLKDTYGIEHFVWLDDDLLKDETRALSLFNGMVRRNLNMTWDATNGLIAASCSDEVVRAMADSGCIAVSIGMESGNPEILKSVKKPGTVKNFLAAAQSFRKTPEIHTRAFLIIGFPGETMAMINDTIRVAEEMGLDWYSTTVLQPLPNTPIFDAMMNDGLIETDNDVRFNSGSYGKQIEFDLGMRSIDDFEEAIRGIPSDAVPTPAQITNIWFFMNYHLNFRRLFTETRRIKLEQQKLNMIALANVISPGHGLALYFLAYVQYRLTGEMDQELVERLRRRLDESPYWASRLKAFGLSVRDLETCDFSGKEVPAMLLGQKRAG